jgi:hypothetical protein
MRRGDRRVNWVVTGCEEQVLDMKNLFDTATANQVKERIGRLGSTSVRHWGKMNAAQAMAHCAMTMEWAVGDRNEPRMFIGRIVGPLVKSKVLKDEAPMGAAMLRRRRVLLWRMNGTWRKNASGCAR